MCLFTILSHDYVAVEVNAPVVFHCVKCTVELKVHQSHIKLHH